MEIPNVRMWLSIVFGLLFSRLVGLGLSFRSTSRQLEDKTTASEEHTREPIPPVKPGHRFQPGGWDNPYAYPLIISRRSEAALIRFMADKGWYHKGKAINYGLEEFLMSRHYLEPIMTPEQQASCEHLYQWIPMKGHALTEPKCVKCGRSPTAEELEQKKVTVTDTVKPRVKSAFGEPLGISSARRFKG